MSRANSRPRYGALLPALLALLLPGVCRGQLGVQAPVLVQEPPARLRFSNSTGAQLSCSARGSPPPDVAWLHTDGSPVTAVPGLRQPLGNGTLYFPPFRAEDYREQVHSATYRCRASNLGGAVLSRDVVVRAVVRQEYEVQVYRAHALLGNTAVLRCVIPPFVRDDVSVSSWFRDDTIILPGGHDTGSSRFVVTSTGDLLVRRATAADASSRYSCLTLHALTGERRRSTPAQLLTVTEATGGMPPRLTQRSTTSLTVEQGRDVTLSCTAQGNPPPTFTWWRENGTPVASSGRVWASQEALHVLGARPEDAGRWECRVHNAFGEQRVHAALQVTAPLQVHVTPHLLVVNSGEAATFNCSVSGAPVGSVEWLHNAEALAAGRARLLAPLVLHVAAAGRAHRGVYQCVARGDGDSAQAAAELRLGDTVPELQWTFVEQALSPGSPASLRCTAAGSPPPQFTWYLDGRPLTASRLGHRYTIGQYVDQVGDVISHVNVSAIRVQDGGLYTCSAANSMGITSHEARLNVYGPPYVRSPMSPVRALESADVTLRCPFAGYPISGVSWERRGVPVTDDLRHELRDGGAALHVRGVDPAADAGAYVCQVRGAAGEVARGEVVLAVDSPPVVEPFNFPVNVREGARAQVTCSVSSGDLPIRFSWLKDNAPIPKDLQVTEKESSEFYSMLVFTKLSSRHSGVYTCVASNNAASGNYSAQLRVKVSPQWLIEPQDMSTLAGNSLLIHCKAEGYPQPVVSWLRGQGGKASDFQSLDTSEVHIMVLSNGSLSIPAANSQDEGHYLCRADNGIGAGLSKVVKITVNEPVSFDVMEKNVTARHGEQVTLNCDIKGDNPIQVDWLFNGQRLNHNYRTSMSEIKKDSGLQSLLVIAQSERHDSGLYTCQAGNIFGHSKLIIHLAVQEPPDPPLDIEVVEINSRSVRLSWHPPFDGHSTLIGYLIQYKKGTSLINDWHHSGTVNLSLPAYGAEFTNGSLAKVHSQSPSNIGFSINLLNPDVYYNGHGRFCPSLEYSAYTVVIPVLHLNVQYIAAIWKEKRSLRSLVTNADSMRTAVITDLHPATTYHIRMLATNAIEASPFTDTLTVKTQEEVPAAPPLDLNAETIGPDELLISWKPPPPDTWNGNILGYIVHWNVHGMAPPDTNSTNTHLVRGLMTTEARLKQLKKFTRYDVYVQAFNSMGPGPKSSAVTATTREGVPDAAPQNVSCFPLSSQSMKVNWAPPPAQHHGGVIQGYKVIYKPVITDSNLWAVGSEVKRTASLDTYLHGLLKFTNYSVRLLAYTSMGDGVLSHSVFCSTEQDVPGSPAAIKAISLTSDSILVSWLPPEHTNGIITLYTVYFKGRHHATKPMSFKVGPTINTHEVRGLKETEQYEFWVTASTIVGEGESGRPVIQAPNSKAPARIASFSQVLKVPLKSSTSLSCLAVGNPTPNIQWLYKKRVLESDSKTRILQDSLHIIKMEKANEGNYTCIAKNLFGEDHITYKIIVLLTPDPPLLESTGSDHNNIELQWRSIKDGGTPILGYLLNYKRDHGNWIEVLLDAEQNSHMLPNLQCGTTYHAYMIAYNRVGNSHPSATITVRTKGTEPQVPELKTLLTTNATSVLLHLPYWPDGGCPMLYFVVEYRILGTRNEWILVDNNVPSMNFLIGDLQPGTWYELRITAHNSAGSTRVHYSMATTTISGATVAPMQESQSLTDTPHFYEDIYVVVSTVCSAVLLLSAGLLIYVAIRRRQCKDSLGGRVCQDALESASICKAAAEMDNKRNFQQIYSSSPSKSDEHHTSKQMDTSSDIYEMSPYATFAVSSECPRSVNPTALDYTIEFKTFGHSENNSVQHERPHRSNRKHRGESRQSSVAVSSLHRHNKASEHERKFEACNNSETDSSGSPSVLSSYRTPIKKTAARSLEMYHADSSPESNEISPLPRRRRAPHQHPLSSVERPTQVHASFEPSSPEVDASVLSYHLQPPSGFSNSQELSEAECDRDSSQLSKFLARFQQQKEEERLQYTIHV